MPVRDTIELQDMFSPVMNQVIDSVNRAVLAVEQMRKTMSMPIDSSAINSAGAYAENLNDAMRHVSEISGLTRTAFYSLGTGTDELAEKIAGAGDSVRAVSNRLKAVGEESYGISAGFSGAASGIGKLFTALGGYKILNTVKDAFSEAGSASAEFEGSAAGALRSAADTRIKYPAVSGKASYTQADTPGYAKIMTNVSTPEYEKRISGKLPERRSLDAGAPTDTVMNSLAGTAADYAGKIEDNINAIQKLKYRYQEQAFAVDRTQISGQKAVYQLKNLSDKTVKTAFDLERTRTAAEKLGSEYRMNIAVDFNTGDVKGLDRKMTEKAAVYETQEKSRKYFPDYDVGNEYRETYLNAKENAEGSERLRREALQAYNEFQRKISRSNKSESASSEAAVIGKPVKAAENEWKRTAALYSMYAEKKKQRAYTESADYSNDFLYADKSENRLNNINEEISNGMTAQSDAQQILRKYREEITGIADSYNKARHNIRQSLNDISDVFEKAEFDNSSIIKLKNALSLDDSVKNIDSHTEYLRRCKEALNQLNEPGTDRNIFLQSEPEQAASFAYRLSEIDMSAVKEKINAVSKSLESLSQIKENITGILSGIENDYSGFMTLIQQNSETNVRKLADNMDNSEGVRKSAFNMLDSYAKQIRIGGAAAAAEAQLIADRISYILASAGGPINIGVNSVENNLNVNLDDKKANGGTAKGGLTLVGENGPELIVLDGGERVYNNAETEKILSAFSKINPFDHTGISIENDIVPYVSYYSSENQSDYSTVNENAVNNYNYNSPLTLYNTQSMYDDTKVIQLLENMRNCFSEFKNTADSNNNTNYTPEYSVDMSLLESLLKKYGNEEEIRCYNGNISYGDTYTADNSSYSTEYGDTVNYGNIRSYSTGFGDKVNYYSSWSRSTEYGDTVNYDNIRSFNAEYGDALYYNSNRICGTEYGETVNYDNSRSFNTEYGDAVDYRSQNCSVDYGNNINYYRTAAVEHDMSGYAENSRGPHENDSVRQIDLNINGSGNINIQRGLDKDEVISILIDNLKPVLMNVVEQEIFEEGEASYDY